MYQFSSLGAAFRLSGNSAAMFGVAGASVLMVNEKCLRNSLKSSAQSLLNRMPMTIDVFESTVASERDWSV